MAKTTQQKPPTKSQIHSEIAEKTDLTKKDVAAVFDALQDVMERSLKQNEAFTLPGLCKMVVKNKPATKARKMVSPFSGEEIDVPAKPASKTVKVRPLKTLKEMAV